MTFYNIESKTKMKIQKASSLLMTNGMSKLPKKYSNRINRIGCCHQFNEWGDGRKIWNDLQVSGSIGQMAS